MPEHFQLIHETIEERFHWNMASKNGKCIEANYSTKMVNCLLDIVCVDAKSQCPVDAHITWNRCCDLTVRKFRKNQIEMNKLGRE